MVLLAFCPDRTWGGYYRIRWLEDRDGVLFIGNWSPSQDQYWNKTGEECVIVPAKGGGYWLNDIDRFYMDEIVPGGEDRAKELAESLAIAEEL